MTVKQLIEKLQKYPMDSEVVYRYEEHPENSFGEFTNGEIDTIEESEQKVILSW